MNNENSNKNTDIENQDGQKRSSRLKKLGVEVGLAGLLAAGILGIGETKTEDNAPVMEPKTDVAEVGPAAISQERGTVAKPVQAGPKPEVFTSAPEPLALPNDASSGLGIAISQERGGPVINVETGEPVDLKNQPDQ